MAQIEYDRTLSFHESVLDALYDLSKIIGQCKIKSLLLPRMIGGNEYCNDHYMTSAETLRRLTKMHQGNSCLILQPQERPYNATIFDAFPNFDIALRQADLWPAVLFWDSVDNCVFVPVKHEDELLLLYQIIKYERDPFREINKIAEERREKSYYIFQLSDLHFGTKSANVAARRLKSLIKTKLSEIELSDNINFIVTGDAVDSPTPTTENDYRNFADFLEEHCGNEPIRVLGNHDVNHHGLAIFHGRQHIANITGKYPKIQIFEESKIRTCIHNRLSKEWR